MLRSLLLKATLLVTLYLSIPCAFAAEAPNDFIHRRDVQDFMTMMVKKHHFAKPYLVSLFKEVKQRPQVIARINKPFEKEPWHIYQVVFINARHIKQGVLFWRQYEAALTRAEKQYGVPASIIVATIGIETKYGKRTGDYRVIDSLSSLGFSTSPRASFFRKELEEFLLLSKEQHLDPLKIMGSYAGAIGQPQFMPSSYRRYAVNFSHSGKTDLMNNEIDVIGSIANYYHQHGWMTHDLVAVPALTIGDRYHYLSKKNKLTQPLTVGELLRYGVVPKYHIDGDTKKVKVIELQNHYSKEYWLGFHNFNVIKRYNSSDLYAMAVYQLSYYIAELQERLPK